MIVVPACSRCSLRKIKCDRKAPKCAACEKARSACVIADRADNQSFSRQHVQELLEEIELLESLQRQRTTANDSSIFDDTWSTAVPNQHDPPSSRGEGFSPDQRTVTDSVGGISFLRYILGQSDLSSHKDHLQGLVARLRPVLRYPKTLHDWPPHETAQLLVNSYLRQSNVHHPFLHPQRLLEILDQIYMTGKSSNSAQDKYTLLMVFAVASVRTHRDGLTNNHPYGYFLAAQKLIAHVPVLGSIGAIQNLLLVARFGMYYDIGTSLWELSHICIRQCVELDLHRNLPQSKTLISQQLGRCVFWDCYMNERYISDTLGRTYAINDRFIETPLPMHISWDGLYTFQPVESILMSDTSNEFTTPNDMSVFLFAIGLRRIQSANRATFSEIHNHDTLSSIKSSVSRTPGLIMHKVHACLIELQKWLAQAPVFPNPTSTYHIPAWYSFLVAKEKLSVTKAALTFLLQLNIQPQRELFSHCRKSAVEVIELFAQLFDNNNISPTRSYFQSLFVSGLSLMFCEFGQSRSSGIDTAYPRSSTTETLTAIRLCARILSNLSRDMPDSKLYYAVFETLSRKFESDAQRDAPSEQLIVESVASQSGQQLNSVAVTGSEAEVAGQGPLTCDIGETQTSSPMVEAISPGALQNHEIFTNMETFFEHDWNWDSLLSDENMQRMFADVGSYAWDQPTSVFAPWEPYNNLA